MVQRLTEKNMKLLKREVIKGAHAGAICRLDVLNEDGENSCLIYKEFAADRNNEVEIYSMLSSCIDSFSKVIGIWESAPQAILMADLGSSLKKDVRLLSRRNKTALLEKVIERLASLHEVSGRVELPVHTVTSEWLEWAENQLYRLCQKYHWAEPGWIKLIEKTYTQLNVINYKQRCPQVITHGDPHLENIFYQDGQVWFIDWEWAAMSSPLRDITILCQDIYDPQLIQFISRTYCKKLSNLTIPFEDYQQDFNYFYIDHTTMMLAWEIEKFFLGCTSEDQIQEIAEFKIGEIKRTVKEEINKMQ
ncbi:phosphotransferase [Lysinibacillus sphaericus]